MNSRDFLDLAAELILGEREADWRSAVSRAYYAAFHVARQLLDICGFRVPQADRSHKYLAQRLMNSGHPEVVDVGLDLDDLRRVRNSADYDLKRMLKQELASAQVQSALDIVQILELARDDQVVRQRITDAMRTYERDVLQDVTWQTTP